MSLGSGGSAWRRSPPVPAHAGLVWGWGGQKNLVWPEVRFLCWDALFLACLRCSRCCSAQVSHLIWPWMVRAQQSTHSPRALASFRLAWVWWRCSSLRSGVLFLFRSYSCRFSFLASTSAGVGSGQRFGVAFLRGLLMVGFRFSFRDFFSLAWGPPPAFCGLGNVKVNSKVRPTARGSGDGVWKFLLSRGDVRFVALGLGLVQESAALLCLSLGFGSGSRPGCRRTSRRRSGRPGAWPTGRPA